MSIETFSIRVTEEALYDLRARLRRTRLSGGVAGAGWAYGTDPAYLAALLRYFHDEFDWRAQEERLNRLPHFRTLVRDFGVHFVHVHGRGERSLPLLLIHGWPDSFLRMEKLIPLLSDPAAHGGSEADAFDLVVPSLPGFGFSDRPCAPGMNPKQIGALFAALMTALGYARNGVHGGDWGSVIAEQIACHVPSALVGIHLADVRRARS